MQVLEGPEPAMLLQRNDVLLGVLPFFHIYGLVFLVLAHLVRGIPLVLIARFDAETMLRAIQVHRVTVAPVVPPILLELARRADMAKYDLTSLRVIMTAAAPLPSGLAEMIRAKLGLEVSQVRRSLYPLKHQVDHCLQISCCSVELSPNSACLSSKCLPSSQSSKTILDSMADS
jgi:acyl-CoA synthetase (AMP-forming)/AMP-acid ligase II